MEKAFSIFSRRRFGGRESREIRRVASLSCRRYRRFSSFFLIRRWHFRTDTLPRWLCLPLCSRLVRRHRGKERLEGEISIKLSDIAVTRRKTKYKPSQKRKEKKKHSNCCRMLKIIPDLSDTLEIKKKAEEKLLAQRRK